MLKIPNPTQMTTLDDLSRISSINIPLMLRSGGFARYMSKVEEDDSKPADPEWDYFVNQHGFRDNWRLLPNTKKIGFFGCSCTFGIGVQSHHTFSSVVEKYYNSRNVESLNLGLPGSGIQRIAKLVSASNKIFNFDYVVVTAPSSTRFLILDEDNLMVDIVPGYVRSDFSHHEKYIYGKFGQNNLDMYYIDYVHWIKSELSNVKKVLWTSWDPETYKIISSIVDKDSLLPHWGFVDRGRDSHPGIRTHYIHAQNIIQRLGKIA